MAASIFQPKFRKKILHGFKWTPPQNKKCHYYFTISISLLAIILVFSFHRYPYPRATTETTTFILINEQKKKKKNQWYNDDWSYNSIPYFDSIMDTVDLHFPGARPSWTTLQAVKAVIEKRGLTPENTLFAQSICPDEINHEPGNSIPNLFAEYLGEVFHLGGLGAIPFTGKTGFAAYSSHVPNGGHLFVLLAPHIGISDNGRHLGQYSRPGQTETTYTTGSSPTSSSSSSSSSSSLSPCCGAAIGALGLPDMTRHMDDNDQEMAYLIQHINQHKHEILNKARSENAILANLARVNHDIALDYLHKIVNVNFGNKNDEHEPDVDDKNGNNNNNNNSTLVILTGIQINLPRPALQEFFQPLSFTMQYKNGTIQDLFHETFNSPQKVTKKKTKKKRPTRQRQRK